MKQLFLICTIMILFSCKSTKIEEGSVETRNQKIENPVVNPQVPKHIQIDIDSIAKKPAIIKESTGQIESDQLLTKELTDIHKDWNELLRKHVSENGDVNYKGFKNDRARLLLYIKVLNLKIPKKTDTKAYTLAYWINTYNAFTVDLILKHYPVKSIKDIKTPWEQRYWKLGEKWCNLNDIEHKILRKMNEPRIHFAIVCASISCPKLQNEAFTESKLEQQLTHATKDFINDDTRNLISENNLELSKIFQWFSKDFKQNGNIIDFINQYSDIKISAKAKKKYKEYNWDLNE